MRCLLKRRVDADYHTKEVEKLLTDRGWKWLEGEYVTGETKIYVQCDIGHKLWITSHSIKTGNGCSTCSGHNRDNAHHTRQVNDVIVGHGGVWLSGEYETYLSRITIKCQDGHVWETTPNCIKAWKWCPACVGKSRDKDYHTKELLRIIGEKGGRLLSDSYTDSETKVTVECASGHQWQTAPRVLKRESWCPRCVGCSRDQWYHTTELLRVIEKMGGRWVSGDYVNNLTKIIVECALGHQWKAAPVSLKQEHWCTICSGHSLDRTTTCRKSTRL